MDPAKLCDDAIGTAWRRGKEIGAAEPGPLSTQAAVTTWMASICGPEATLQIRDDHQVKGLKEALDDCEDDDQRDALMRGFWDGFQGDRS